MSFIKRWFDDISTARAACRHLTSPQSPITSCFLSDDEFYFELFWWYTITWFDMNRMHISIISRVVFDALFRRHDCFFKRYRKKHHRWLPPEHISHMIWVTLAPHEHKKSYHHLRLLRIGRFALDYRFRQWAFRMGEWHTSEREFEMRMSIISDYAPTLYFI